MRPSPVKLTAYTLAALLGACALPGTTSSDNNTIASVFAALTNKAITDMQNGKALALAATPPDNDGAACFGALPSGAAGDLGSGGLAVAAAFQKLAAVQQAQAVGPLGTAEFLSIVQPASDQWNWAVKTLETACIAKIHDINQAVNSTAGVFAALPAVLGLAAAPVAEARHAGDAI